MYSSKFDSFMHLTIEALTDRPPKKATLRLPSETLNLELLPDRPKSPLKSGL